MNLKLGQYVDLVQTFSTYKFDIIPEIGNSYEPLLLRIKNLKNRTFRRKKTLRASVCQFGRVLSLHVRARLRARFRRTKLQTGKITLRFEAFGFAHKLTKTFHNRIRLPVHKTEQIEVLTSVL